MSQVHQLEDGTPINSFWARVDSCEHRDEDSSPDYGPSINCMTPYCEGHEYHCLRCGVYISHCGCGSNNGMSGWPMRRWNKRHA